MMPGDVLALLFTILLPTLFLLYLARRFFSYKEKQLELNSRVAAERAAEYAVSNSELEQRVRVLEQIVTDAGAQTAGQIEALRDRRAIEVESHDK
jgi:ABC-type phosphate transport system auxiliary subunit